MLKSLTIKNFTVFSEAQLDFSPGLNVVIGENATGKSHLLKLAYAIISIWHEARLQKEEMPRQNYWENMENWWQRRLAEKLVGIFKPDRLSNLHYRCKTGDIYNKTELEANVFTAPDCGAIKFLISGGGIRLLKNPDGFFPTLPLFFPAKEVLSLYPGFMSLYKKYKLPIDETYYDLCDALSSLLLNKTDAIENLIKPLEDILGGKVQLESDRFYIQFPEQGKMEISLVAEGLRKIAMLTYLIANDSLKKGSILFWDEPEANLNPKMMKQVARSLAQLAENGVQIILATHNLFLMKELSLLAGKMQTRFFSLVQGEKGNNVEQGKILTDLSTIVALDEELAIFDREQEAFYAAKG